MSTQIPKLPRMSLRLVLEPEPNYTPTVIKSPPDVAKFLQWLEESPEEQFVVVHLNSKHEPIGLQVVSHGTLSASLVHPREVFKAALLANSYAIIVAHNHPSGSKLEPSREDKGTTEQLVAAGNLLGVSVLDHLLLGPGQEPMSLREEYPGLWRDA